MIAITFRRFFERITNLWRNCFRIKGLSESAWVNGFLCISEDYRFGDRHKFLLHGSFDFVICLKYDWDISNVQLYSKGYHYGRRKVHDSIIDVMLDVDKKN